MLKQDVKAFWEKAACGEVYPQGAGQRERFEEQARARYELEPYLGRFAKFEEGRDKDVLEIGVGLGADHTEWAKAKPKSLTGVDLTERAIEQTRSRLALYGLDSTLKTADAEHLPFPESSFDLVYSYGVLHHTPDTRKAIDEVYRVLRPGGVARVMIYHSRSLVGYMLWLRYGLLTGRPQRSLSEIYAEHLESPGTQAFSVPEARSLFARFRAVTARPQLSPGDLLGGATGQRHGGLALSLARRAWPRPLIKRALKDHGLALLIEAGKWLGPSPRSQPPDRVRMRPMTLWDWFLMGGWVMWPILATSIVALGVVIGRVRYLIRTRGDGDALTRDVLTHIGAGRSEDALRTCAGSRLPTARVLHAGLEGLRDSHEELDRRLEFAAAVEVDAAEKGLATLGTTLALLPMLGFLGTILGLIQSFVTWQALGEAAKIDQLSGGIAAAMITTGAGLVAAIPYTLAYNVFSTHAHKLSRQLNAAGSALSVRCRAVAAAKEASR